LEKSQPILNVCIIKPNNNAFSETFIDEHINRLPGNKKVLYGGAFPIYDHQGKFLIKSKIGLISYLIQKRFLRKQKIHVRTSALVHYLREHSIDVVFAEYGMVGAMVAEACKIAEIPLVIHFHGADVHHRKTVSIYCDLYKEAFNYASAYIAVSGDMVEALKELGASPSKITHASCGVNTEAFPKLDIRNTKRNFLSVGRFVEKKSPQSIVKAFKKVVTIFPDAHLWMVGSGPLLTETKKLSIQLELTSNITFTGILNPKEIKDLIKTSRCFVQHSVTAVSGDKEGTPVTILEAGSSGLAIVSTSHAGIKEAVIHSKTGYLVQEHDIDGMAEYMIKIAEDVNLAAELGESEAVHIRQNYDIKNRITKLTEILYSAVNNKK